VAYGLSQKPFQRKLLAIACVMTIAWSTGSAIICTAIRFASTHAGSQVVPAVSSRVGDSSLAGTIIALREETTGAMTDIGHSLYVVRYEVLCLGIFGIVLGGGSLWLLLVRVQRPLGDLTGRIRDLHLGGASTLRLEKSRDDDLGTLPEEINILLAQWEQSETSLRAYKMEFERRVVERTRQLDATLADAHEATKRAEGASRAKSDFLAKMSHEIRTPLNGVLGMSELLEQSQTLDDRQRRYAVVIHQSGKALLQLINDLLDFSKIEAGKLELIKERFCVREMVEDSLEIFAERAQSKELELICDIPADLDTVVFGDCLRVRQVVLNLLSNAVKFTDHGEITVSVRANPGIESTVFTFEVTDTGVGIAEGHTASIFDAFVQADTSSSRRYGGTGLGLAISKQLIELMGGTISLQSTLGAGSSFTVAVPLAVDRTAKRDKPDSMLRGTRVLIVEKSEGGRKMLRQHLKSWGATTTEISTADELLSRLRKSFSGEFEVLIIDGHLLADDLVELVDAIRGAADFAETPILLLHAGVEPPRLSREMKGPVTWQSKPIRRSQLQIALQRLLGLATNEHLKGHADNAATGTSDTVRLHKATVRQVLMVEDNPVNREVARAMLQTLPVQVEAACDGNEALEKLAAMRFDAVLMDCEMPDIDGYETTRRFRAWEASHGRPRTPVIALTANALAGDAERCFEAGMDHYISKPFTIDALREVLERCGPAPVTGDVQPPPSGDVLDPKTLSRIRSLSANGAPDLIKRLKDVYRKNSRALVEQLRVAIANEDSLATRRAAHGLKSSSANVGALQLAGICGELEHAARADDKARYRPLARQLIREHRTVLRALNEMDALAS
jgi:two-component system, sensor histidine kinase and response regulator